MPEVVEDGVSGFVVPPNSPCALRQKIQWFVTHPEEAKEMGLMARRRVEERFTWSAVVDRCMRIYAGDNPL
jgi:glycosyltransferase involved in cell wall biosynthesis